MEKNRDDTLVKELFKSWDASQEKNDTSDDEITLVKERIKSSNTDNDKNKHRSRSTNECDKEKSKKEPVKSSNADCDKNRSTTDCDKEKSTTITDNRSTENDHDKKLREMRRENKELQESLKDLFSQTKLLKNENESLLKLVENKDKENKTLRVKFNEICSEKEKIDSALTRAKGDLSKANAQILIYEEDISKLRQLNETVTKEKSKLLEQLMKKTGAKDSVESKLDKATENLENKVTSEIHELKKVLMKELNDVKSQIQKSQYIRSTSTNNNQKSTEGARTMDGTPKQISTVVSSREDRPTKTHTRNEQHSAFIAGDSITRILSAAKMSDSALGVKIKSHPGGRIKTIENTVVSMIDKDLEHFKELDAVVLHVGTNNIADAASCESITDEITDTIHTIESANSNVRIVVSSVLPRQKDRLVNDMIRKTNTSLKTMCQEKGHYFLDNTAKFIHQGSVDSSLYRDNIHLNAKGGKTLGTSMREALNKVLDIEQSSTITETSSPSFHNGRFTGRRSFNNNRNMVFMPVPQYLLNNQNPWFVPNHNWY